MHLRENLFARENVRMVAVPDQAGDLAGKAARLRSSADRLAVLDEEIGAERRRRDELITELRDEGLSWSKLAAAARLSPSQCVHIVSTAA